MARAPAKTKGSRARVPVTEGALAEALLKYLDRFETTRAKLRLHLEKWVKARGEPPDPVRARPLIDRVLSRYETAGVVSDGRFAERAVERMRARGGSTRAIAFKLRTKGLDSSTMDSVFEAERATPGNAELTAARALVKRRRLGDFRPEADRAAQRRRDLGVLARAGFSYETSVSALGGRSDDDF